MPEKKTLEREKKAKRAGKSPGSQAGEFVREEIKHIREHKHGARSTEQAIAIGLSKARRAGVKLPVPAKGRADEATREQAKRDLDKGRRRAKPDKARSRGMTRKLKKEGHAAASHEALSRHAKAVARRRSKADRSRSARKAAATRRK